jgi:hypothetical protein
MWFYEDFEVLLAVDGDGSLLVGRTRCTRRMRSLLRNCSNGERNWLPTRTIIPAGATALRKRWDHTVSIVVETDHGSVKLTIMKNGRP